MDCAFGWRRRPESQKQCPGYLQALECTNDGWSSVWTSMLPFNNPAVLPVPLSFSRPAGAAGVVVNRPSSTPAHPWLSPADTASPRDDKLVSSRTHGSPILSFSLIDVDVNHDDILQGNRHPERHGTEGDSVECQTLLWLLTVIVQGT